MGKKLYSTLVREVRRRRCNVGQLYVGMLADNLEPPEGCAQKEFTDS